jgi:acyl-coenzyme A synthetase/AMP-(fatty) acid ligase
VPLSAEQILASARTYADHFGLLEDDRGLVTGPLSRADRLSLMVAGIVTGGTLVIESSSSGVSWQDIHAYEVTWASLSPEDVERLGRSNRAGSEVERVRFVQVGADELPMATHAAFWQHTGIPLLEAYTLSEAAGVVSANSLAMPARRRPGSVGRPIGVELRVVDDFGYPVGPSEKGRIQVRGQSVASCYLSYGRDRSMIPSIDGDGWLTTGDLGVCRRDGTIVLVGREA